MKRWLKIRFVNFLVGHLFNTITTKDFLVVDKLGNVFLGGKKLSMEEKEQMIQSAEALRDNMFWKNLSNEMAHEANKKIYFYTKDPDDAMWGKAMLGTIDLEWKKILQFIALRK